VLHFTNKVGLLKVIYEVNNFFKNTIKTSKLNVNTHYKSAEVRHIAQIILSYFGLAPRPTTEK